MEYLYFKSKKGNFGDDLNGWLWPQIFNGDATDCYFLGIGSLLHEASIFVKSYNDKPKIIFGTGVKPSKNYIPLVPDNSWDIRFLRGPLSAAALGSESKFITDAAYAVRYLENYGEKAAFEKKYEISVMPYFHSVDLFNWKGICDKLGFHYISPLSEQGVEHTLQEIAASKTIITEAMHGAILADALRVPWHRFILSTPYTEGIRISDFKWLDWMLSAGIYKPATTLIPLFQPQKGSRLIEVLLNKKVVFESSNTKRVESKIIQQLGKMSDFNLSTDKSIANIDDRIAQEISKIVKYEESPS